MTFFAGARMFQSKSSVMRVISLSADGAPNVAVAGNLGWL